LIWNYHDIDVVQSTQGRAKDITRERYMVALQLELLHIYIWLSFSRERRVDMSQLLYQNVKLMIVGLHYSNLRLQMDQSVYVPVNYIIPEGPQLRAEAMNRGGSEPMGDRGAPLRK